MFSLDARREQTSLDPPQTFGLDYRIDAAIQAAEPASLLLRVVRERVENTNLFELFKRSAAFITPPIRADSKPISKSG